MANATDTPPSGTRSEHRSVLLYDGDCGFCAGSVQFVLRHEPAAARGRLAFAPLQSAFGTRVREQFPELVGVDSVVWYDPAVPAVRVRSAAALAATAHLGGLWAVAATLARLVPRGLRDAIYDKIARRRFEIAAPACLLPTPEERARFLP
ncbi:DCC1-like thiol-disulfide oxidoreductase family protein [Gemmatimonas sp.]|uniref:thiol-disulfide oxidoreductase DCC family protein n=1 Tax=Gemmatimonas sp. TaxID=1962908 RepID=UPI00286D8905|nr:DCC1-like thiol-disulfide oxidoreductase family protein [Gemmatimonas sp.]